ncbi:MAG: response regulator [Thermodesulfobacteriota bacterium]|nr:response regulator [Thermodesulfobacteriota bacterium]
MERILVVDDEPEVCNALNEFLSSKGYEVYTALDGISAIKKVKEVRPHIVLLDVIMPGMGGIDTLQEIKKIDSKIGIIMITAVADHELAKRAIDIGAYSYITKPLDLNYIETVVMVKILDFLD